MTEEKTQQLTAGITGGTGDRNTYCHMHDYATSGTTMLIVSKRGTPEHAVESGVDLWADARQPTG